MIVKYLSTADTDTLIRPLVQCTVLQRDVLAMRTPVRKAFTTDVGQTQQWRHHMTVHGLQLSCSTSYDRKLNAFVFCSERNAHTRSSC